MGKKFLCLWLKNSLRLTSLTDNELTTINVLIDSIIKDGPFLMDSNKEVRANPAMEDLCDLLDASGCEVQDIATAIKAKSF